MVFGAGDSFGFLCGPFIIYINNIIHLRGRSTGNTGTSVPVNCKRIEECRKAKLESSSLRTTILYSIDKTLSESISTRL